MQLSAKNILTTAYHEAGHAAAAVTFGFRVLELSIDPTPDQLGRTRIAATLKPGQDRWFDRHNAVIAACGPITEATVRCVSMGERCCSQKEMDRVREMSNRLEDDPQKQDKMFKNIIKKAFDVVDARWLAINAIAQALYEYTSLTEWEVCELYRLNQKRN